jgi:hypothetical protein
MKKQITEGQLLSLSDTALAELVAWGSRHGDLQRCILWKRRSMVVPQLSIGDMLELLEEEAITLTVLSLPERPSHWCDHLWSLVQLLLEGRDDERDDGEEMTINNRSDE